jgi:hypothetical protein
MGLLQKKMYIQKYYSEKLRKETWSEEFQNKWCYLLYTSVIGKV